MEHSLAAEELKVKGGIGGREPHGFLGNLQEAHPLWEETVWMDRMKWSLQHSNQMRVSQESGQSGQTGRGFRVKVNLPTFKDEKAKDAVTYHSWHWDMSMCLHCSGWDDHCHLLPYVFRSLQGFPGDLVKEFGWGCHPGGCSLDLGWTLWCHDDLQCLKQGALFPQAGNGRECGWVLEYAYPNRFMDTPDRVSQQNPTGACRRRWSGIASMKALVQSIGECWPTRLMVKILSPILNCSLLPGSWKDGWKPEILCSWKPLLLGAWNITCSHSQGNLFPSRKLKGSCTFTAKSTAVEDHETEEDSGPKPNGDKEAKSSAEEDMGMLGEIGNVDPSLGYITQFAKCGRASTKKKNCNCFGCGSPWITWWKTAQRIWGKPQGR